MSVFWSNFIQYLVEKKGFWKTLVLIRLPDYCTGVSSFWSRFFFHLSHQETENVWTQVFIFWTILANARLIPLPYLDQRCLEGWILSLILILGTVSVCSPISPFLKMKIRLSGTILRFFFLYFINEPCNYTKGILRFDKVSVSKKKIKFYCTQGCIFRFTILFFLQWNILQIKHVNGKI